ncbi:MAG: asparagine synthase (glutamine-hydrolyzing) [Chitinophagaceae bacterium]|nr:asparagine synthase (glutamine-hydrolyzing) [Chitinophagaceae bacterium]
MCGIYGAINTRIAKEVFVKELHKMQHRGPDGYGIWQSADERVLLGHRRLAIIDTDARSNQPMVMDGRYIIVFNGEIYNYIEIRNELQKEGVQFKTSSDTEVLLRLMIHKGPQGLSLLNGMWSFVLFDEVEQTLFVSRDRIGKKPLYYVHDSELFAFSSEIKNLVCYLNHVEYDKSFIDFSVNNLFDAEAMDQTIIKGIRKFPAASFGIFRGTSLNISKYYYPEELLEINEAVETFADLFQSSCSLRMRSDVPVGSALSGGIDSSMVVSTIAQLGYGHSKGYKALVSSFPGSFIDETADAFAIAKNAGVDVEAVNVNPDLDPNHILRAVYHFEEIAGTSPIPFFQLYQGFRNRNVVVTLDGHGGDELFGGYSFDLYNKLQDDFPNIFEMQHTLDTINKMYGNENGITVKQTIPYFKGELLQRLKKRQLLTIFEKEQHYKRKLFHSTFKGILPTLLRNYDKYSMYAGVEVRMPFLDYRLIEFAFSLPNNYKLRGGFTKAIVRSAARKLVPDKILANKVKTGWNSPMGEWFAGPWKQWLLDELASTAFNNCTLIDQADIQKRVSSFFEKQHHNAGQDIWLKLQPYLIEKANKQFSHSYNEDGFFI